jgi:hypothetical protein
MTLKEEHFECIKEENSEEEDERQWERSRIVFDHFHEYLLNRGLKEETADDRTQRVIFFVMDYLFVYRDVESILEVSADTIRMFLGNWYIRKFLNPKMSEIKFFLRAILDFYKFLLKEDILSEADLEEMEGVCKDIPWFEMRLKTYFEADDDDEFREWLQEYNYDW